jgi:hypothetical protein
VQKSMNQLVFLVASLMVSFLSIRASAGTMFDNSGFDSIKLYPQRTWDLELTGRYLQSSSNFTTSGGGYANTPAGNSYNISQFNLGFRTTIDKKNWAIWGDSQAGYAQSQSPAQTLTNGNVDYVRLGTDYILFQDAFALIPEFFFQYPTVQNNFTNTSTVGISDGVTVVSGKMYVRIRLTSFLLQAFAGYQYRDQGRSSLIPYGVVAEYLMHNWSAGANLQGYSSASQDANTNNPTQQYAWMNSVNGASQIWDGVNPQLLETNVWLKFHTSPKVSLFVGAGDTLNGASTANYWNVSAGIEYHVPSSKPKVSDPIENTNQMQFDEELSDGVDQRLFDKSNTPPAEVKPKPVAPPRAPSPQNLQKELDKTEMKLDLKSKQNTNPSDSQ